MSDLTARATVRDSAIAVFARDGFSASVRTIAEAAGVSPGLVIHHFGSKDALYVGSAFGLLLRQSERLREAGHGAATPGNLGRTLASTAMSMTSLSVVVGAMAVARANPSVQPAVDAGLTVLFRQSSGYLRTVLRDRGWKAGLGVDRSVRIFWSAVFGSVLTSRASFDRGMSAADLAAALPIADT